VFPLRSTKFAWHRTHSSQEEELRKQNSSVSSNLECFFCVLPSCVYISETPARSRWDVPDSFWVVQWCSVNWKPLTHNCVWFPYLSWRN
jgi:hypothetical protein